MRMWGLDHPVNVGGRCCGFVALAVPYDRRMEVARRGAIGGSAAAPGHPAAIQGEAHHRSFKSISGCSLPEQIVVVALPLIEQEGDAEYG